MYKAFAKRIRRILHSLGYDFVDFPDKVDKRKINLYNRYTVEIILDVGANEGQYATFMRDIGFQGEIISFEPLKEAFNSLKARSEKDLKWQVFNYALGDFNGPSTIHISGNSQSSSLLDMNTEHLEAAPSSNYISQAEIQVCTLDSVYNKLIRSEKPRVLLKIDTQGFEKNVLEGAVNSLDRIVGVQLEMSLVELYHGEMLYNDMKQFLENLGFTLCLLEPGFQHPGTGKLLQIDGLFFRIDNW